MNLQRHLLSRILLVALLCLALTCSLALYRSHQQQDRHTEQMATALAKQLESQLLLARAGIGQANPFPDFGAWKQSASQPGVCIVYSSADRASTRSLCSGAELGAVDWPDWFAAVYKQIFRAGRPVERSVALDAQTMGVVTVTPHAESEIAQAWLQVNDLLLLSGLTLSAVCSLVYLSIRRALRPAQDIVSGLAILEAGQLDYRLAKFELNEWQRIAASINQLAASQQQLLEERQRLAVKLIGLQERERHDLARELHDEFGQCLAAINARLTIIKQTAMGQCPAVADEAERIAEIAAHMLNGIRDMLGRLRPAELDQLGLAASLGRLVSDWNGHGGGKTRYRLKIVGQDDGLSVAQAVTLFRITQEALTNVAKHAEASQVDVDLLIGAEQAVLTVLDNGQASHLPFANQAGIGLLGIRERLSVLQGQLQLAIAGTHGLLLTACLPLGETTEPSP